MKFDDEGYSQQFTKTVESFVGECIDEYVRQIQRELAQSILNESVHGRVQVRNV